MDRRTLAQAIATLGLSDAHSLWAAGQEPETFLFQRNAWMPNNERLPVLLYRRVLAPGIPDLATAIEMLLTKNAWQPQWRNGVYPFHHYHSTAHEVLGFARGEAKLLLGGEAPLGQELTVRAGDVAVLPCGTGHCRISASADFLVIGAYALNQNWDLCRAAPDALAIERMRTLPFPSQDPVAGPKGPLTRLWR